MIVETSKVSAGDPAITVLERAPSLESAWNALVRASAEGWAWGLYAWQDVVCGYARLGTVDRGFALAQDGRLVAVMPLHHVPAERRLSSSGFGIAGPMLAPDLGGRRRRKILGLVFDRVRAIAADLECETVNVGWSPVCSTCLQNVRGVNPFLEYGLEDISAVTRVIDLSVGEDRLWAGLSSDARQKIKQARARGYVARRVSWSESLDAYVTMHGETYRRTGAAPHDTGYFEGIATRMEPEGAVCLWAGFTPEGRVAAFHSDARHGPASYYHMGCSDDEALESGLNYLVFWEAMTGALNDGCRWYEVGHVFPGAPAGKERGLTVFKSKFGGDLHRHMLGRLTLRPPAGAEPSTGQADVFAEWLAASRSLGDALIGEAAMGGLRRIVRPIRSLAGPRRRGGASPVRSERD